MSGIGVFTEPINSTRVIVNDSATVSRKLVQYRFPKSKKRRIRIKWRKRNENFRWKESYRIIKMSGSILVHSTMYEKLIQLYN